jgi:hypothetical protein
LQAGLQSVLGAMRVENSRSLLSLKNPRLSPDPPTNRF